MLLLSTTISNASISNASEKPTVTIKPKPNPMAAPQTTNNSTSMTTAEFERTHLLSTHSGPTTRYTCCDCSNLRPTTEQDERIITICCKSLTCLTCIACTALVIILGH